MADPTSNTGTTPTQDPQDDVILQILINHRDSFEAAYEYWRGQIGAVDSDNDAVVFMLLMQDRWRSATAALDRRFRR